MNIYAGKFCLIRALYDGDIEENKEPGFEGFSSAKQNATLPDLRKDLESINITLAPGCRVMSLMVDEKLSGHQMSAMRDILTHIDDVIELYIYFHKLCDDDHALIRLAQLLSMRNRMKILGFSFHLSSGYNKAFMRTVTEAFSVVVRVNSNLEKLIIKHSSQYHLCTFVDAMKSNEAIACLELSNSYVSTTTSTFLAEMLRINTHLKILDLQNCQLRRDGIKCIAEALKFNSSLTSIDLSYNDISSSGCVAIGNALKVNKSLVKINLSFTKISDTKAIGEALACNIVLTGLHLSNNRIGCTGAMYIANGLKVNQSITELDLSKNNIRCAGGSILFNALQTNRTLITLNMSGNKLVNLESIEMTISTNSSLRHLDLSYTSLSDFTAYFIGEGLKFNKNLQTINLCANSIYRNGSVSIGIALGVNKSLVQLNLSDNSLSDVGIECIIESLRINRTLKILSLDSCENVTDIAVKKMTDALIMNQTLSELRMSFGQTTEQAVSMMQNTLENNKALSLVKLSPNGCIRREPDLFNYESDGCSFPRKRNEEKEFVAAFPRRYNEMQK